MEFFGIGPLELVLIVVVVFLVVGPDKLPLYGHKAGEFIAKARRTVNEAKGAITSEIGDIENPMKETKQAARKVLDLPPSPDFEMHFNFDDVKKPNGSSSAKQPPGNH